MDCFAQIGRALLRFLCVPAVIFIALRIESPLGKTKRKPSSRSIVRREPPSLANALLARIGTFHTGADMISGLPDDILISILSSLPVKFGIQTSILSQRWRNLYKSVSSFELSCSDLLGADDGKPHDSTLIVDLVLRFLRRHSGSNIHTLHLNCCLNPSDREGLEQIICCLRRLGVQNLYLYCCCCKRISDVFLSTDVLSQIPTLKRFELSKCILKPGLNTLCDSLQILFLEGVRLLEGALDSILSNCFRLHTLTLSYCRVAYSKLCITGPNLQLKCLYVLYCKDVEEIELYASNLVMFELGDKQVINLIFNHVPQLQTVSVHIHAKNVMAYVAGEIARDLPHLRNLNFSSKGYSFQEGNRVVRFNMFCNLRRLDFSLFNTPKINLLLLRSFLQSCPLLQEFHLSLYHLKYSGSQVEKQPLVFHPELKNMIISGFQGVQNEIEFALYILRIAVNLEKMQISRCRENYEAFGNWYCPGDETPWSEETHKMVLKQLQHVSKTAQLIIQHQVQV